MAQIKVYAGDETSRKWDVICSRFTSKTAAFAAMVEQYYGVLVPEPDYVVRILRKVGSSRPDGYIFTSEDCRLLAERLSKKWPGCITYDGIGVTYRGPKSNLVQAGLW